MCTSGVTAKEERGLKRYKWETGEEIQEEEERKELGNQEPSSLTRTGEHQVIYMILEAIWLLRIVF